MMTSSNGNIFRVTGHLCGEFTGDRWIPRTKASEAELWCFFFICAWMNGWVNNNEAGDVKRHRAHYDVDIMLMGQLNKVFSSKTWKRDSAINNKCWNQCGYVCNHYGSRAMQWIEVAVIQKSKVNKGTDSDSTWKGTISIRYVSIMNLVRISPCHIFSRIMVITISILCTLCLLCTMPLTLAESLKEEIS